MNPSLMSQLDEFARGLVPLGITFTLVLFETMPLPLPGAVAPALSLIALYYWAVYRPDLMPPIAVFMVGILLDVVTGASVGVNALILLLVYGTVLSQRRFLLGKSFNVLWFGFFLTAFVAGLINWLILSVLNDVVLDPTPLIIQLLITVLIYPLFSWLLGRTQKAVIREPEA